jgi:hypothetical protein
MNRSKHTIRLHDILPYKRKTFGVIYIFAQIRKQCFDCLNFFHQDEILDDPCRQF